MDEIWKQKVWSSYERTWQSLSVTLLKTLYLRYRFSPAILSYSVWLYQRLTLGYRDVEDLLAERVILVSYESIRRWCLKFGPCFQRSFKRRERLLGDDWFAHEVFVSIGCQQHYLWRAVDQNGDLLDILVQTRRNQKAADRFFRKVLGGQGREPRRLVIEISSRLPTLTYVV